MESPESRPPQKKTASCLEQIGKLIEVILATWKTTLGLVIALGVCWHERFWTDPVMRFTCPMLVVLLSLPILDVCGFSFVELYRKHKKSRSGGCTSGAKAA